MVANGIITFGEHNGDEFRLDMVLAAGRALNYQLGDGVWVRAQALRSTKIQAILQNDGGAADITIMLNGRFNLSANNASGQLFMWNGYTTASINLPSGFVQGSGIGFGATYDIFNNVWTSNFLGMPLP